MIVSTRKHGRVNPLYAFMYQFNRAVTYVPVDSARNYVLDATDKYNVYDEVPSELLGSYGLYISKEDNAYDLVYVTNKAPVTQALFIQGQITPNGKVDGEAQFSSNSYSRHSAIESYKTDGEKKYIDYLRGGNNSLTVSGLKFENMEVDSLPLMQHIDFKTDLAGSDDNYIYFTPNMFTMLGNNPFLSDTRYSDIDFGYKKIYSISGMFKLPAGYTIDALPKNVTMTMPDNSITFKRILANQNGSLVVRYVLNYNKSIYFKEDYPEVHEFHKKMQEMLAEAIVLKKG
jgi:hypothetical protein